MDPHTTLRRKKQGGFAVVNFAFHDRVSDLATFVALRGII